MQRSHLREKMEHPLLVFVYRNPLGDCTLDGITNQKTQLMLAEPDYTGTECKPDLAVARDPNGYIFAVPWALRAQSRGEAMYGGNHVYTSDSRFVCDYPIKVHDRLFSKERQCS